MALIETGISGEQAQKNCDQANYMWKLKGLAPYLTFDDANSEKTGMILGYFRLLMLVHITLCKKKLWREINGNYIMAGEFNETSNMSERNGNGRSEMQRRCNDFVNWIEN